MFIDYYAILSVSPTATQDEIKTAYKKASLKCHPDRVVAGPNLEQRRKKATIEFQKMADAYFVLSDPQRRRNYDNLRAQRGPSYSTSSSSSQSFFSQFFGGGGGSGSGSPPPAESATAPEDPNEEELNDDEESSSSARPDPEYVFGNVFEEMLRPEVESNAPIWKWVGAASGAGLGFILGNIPGAAVGGISGSKLGSIRDAKGKAVIDVFRDLGGDQKAEILRNLAMKVLGAATSNY